jgi:hypothetical protein
VELAVGSDCQFDQGRVLGLVAQVDREEEGLGAFGAEGGCGFLAAVFLDIGEDYFGAFGGGLAGAAEAETLGGSGD